MADINQLREDVWYWIEQIKKDQETLRTRYKELIEAEQRASRSPLHKNTE